MTIYWIEVARIRVLIRSPTAVPSPDDRLSNCLRWKLAAAQQQMQLPELGGSSSSSDSRAAAAAEEGSHHTSAAAAAAGEAFFSLSASSIRVTA